MAEPVVKKWLEAGFTAAHVWSEKYHAEAGRYAMPDIQPMRDLLWGQSKDRPIGDMIADVERLRSHFIGTQYEAEAILLCELLDPRPHTGPAPMEPTNAWTTTNQPAPLRVTD
jgi:hypothetical protein